MMSFSHRSYRGRASEVFSKEAGPQPPKYSVRESQGPFVDYSPLLILLSVHTFKASHPVAVFNAAQRAVNFLLPPFHGAGGHCFEHRFHKVFLHLQRKEWGSEWFTYESDLEQFIAMLEPMAEKLVNIR
jgi:hypothetical protein